MSKIVKLTNAKPITCNCCGCVYEFDSGDIVEVSYGEYCYAGKVIITSRKLACPNCHFSNEIEFAKENCENE